MPKTLTQKIVAYLPNLDRVQIERYLENTLAKEQFLRRILDTINEGVIAVTGRGTVGYANASIYDVLGIQAEKVTGMQLKDCLRDPALREAVLATDHDAYISMEVTVKYPRQLTLVIQVIPLPEDEREHTEDDPVCLLLFRDVSHERLQYGDRERKSRIETLRLLTAGVAHEIGNPLSAIILHTQLMDRVLKRMPEDTDVQELDRINQIVNEESTRLKRIIADFLNAVRPLSIKLRRGNVAALLEEVFELLYSELTDKNIAVIKSFDESVETLFDPDQLRSVFINVIRNAMDAMPDGGTLTVTMQHRGSWLELSFRDDGCGIDEETLSRIFEPFYTTKPEGSGLGLLIVQRIIHAHGGIIRVESAEQNGTEITIELPVRLTTGKRPLPSPKKKRKHEKNSPRHR
jgi:signal transduction histidine kinase